MRIIALNIKLFYFSSLWLQIWAKDFVPPNIVIIVADDMGFDDVSFRGGHEFITPNIDALAYHGHILNRMYTPPVCTPSRATLLTGLYPLRTGSQHYVMANEEPWSILSNHTNMAKTFQDHGYSTNLVGKWHLGMGRREFTPTHQGFDYHYGYWGAYIDYYRKTCKMPVRICSMGYDFRRNLDIECTSEDDYATDLFTKEAERIIMENGSSKPLFMMVTHLAPHSGNDDDPLQAPFEDIQKFSYIPDIRRRTYAAMISKLDESVGRIVQALDEARMLNNSIIVFYSDNGAPSVGFLSNTGSNWPLKGQKHSPWEGGIRVPGAIWSALLEKRGSIYQQTMYAADWFPTLAAAANIELNLPLDGLNLWPDLVNGDYTTNNIPQYQEREIIHMFDEIWNVTSYTKGRFKYIKGTTSQGEYDKMLSQRNPHSNDPRETLYEEAIKTSMVSKSLQKNEQNILTNEKINNLRQNTKVRCGPDGAPCDALKEECLYNIWLDPCEQNNLASRPEFAHVLKEMRLRVKTLGQTAVKPKTGGSVEKNDPARHDCIWSNFLQEPPTEYISQCGYHSSPCRGVWNQQLLMYLLYFLWSCLAVCALFVAVYLSKQRHYDRVSTDPNHVSEGVQLNVT
ncbi:arylsulfatase B [Stomoxys calcitrans]|uniref:arylsulfatase B n=1 Tax=Stomoxys calcitrans TaxID=35570 RepID=UPI0027E2E7F7|nr:arylsulfatase B [Stomoxys calcitrans]